MHDIAIALSYLHKLEILHRCLTSNNILIRSGPVAKISDLMMTKYDKINSLGSPSRVHTYNTPSHSAYTAPEVLQDTSKYYKQSDVFSWGVISIHLLSKQKPTPLLQQRLIDTKYVVVPEMERRDHELTRIDPDHPLILLTLYAIKDNYMYRPSANQLCDFIDCIKDTTNLNRKYSVG